MGTLGDLFLGFLAVLFPPIAVWIKRGICSLDSILNILLCVLGYLPGLIHAWYIIAKYPDEYERLHHDAEGGRVSYYYVSREPGQQHHLAGPGSGAPDGGRAHREQQRGYGTAGQGQQQSAGQQQSGTVNAEAGGPSSSDARAPPTYAEAVKGDNKVQTP